MGGTRGFLYDGLMDWMELDGSSSWRDIVFWTARKGYLKPRPGRCSQRLCVSQRIDSLQNFCALSAVCRGETSSVLKNKISAKIDAPSFRLHYVRFINYSYNDSQ